MYRFFRVLILLGSVLFISSCGFSSQAPAPTGAELSLRAVSYARLPNWESDSHAAALQAFERSCAAILRREPRDWFGPSRAFGQVSKWQRACRNAPQARGSNLRAKRFFESHFQPYHVSGRGTFTGYYEVAVRGSRTRSAQYSFPVYARPSDLAARSPYYSRAQINDGILSRRNLEILYLQTAADAFLLHVQGSGAVYLSDGSQTRLSYAGNNGHGFKSILSALRAAGYDTRREGGSMLDYRRWLNQNPQKAVQVIEANPRYIFFRETNGNGPVGAQGVELTAGRSLAVDDTYLAYGVPIYLDTTFIDPDMNNRPRNLERLVIAQDTGAAIKGRVRGDFFWGTGEAALKYAGRMKQEGRYTLLLPR